MLCFCCLRWNHRNWKWTSENTKAGNTTNISIIWPQWISVLLFHHFFVVFTPQLLHLRSGRVERCETEKRPPLLTSDLISSLGWPHCLIRILHDWSALIRPSAWPSLPGSETSDSCSSLWKRRDSREIRTGSPWMDLWKATADFWWACNSEENTVAYYSM